MSKLALIVKKLGYAAPPADKAAGVDSGGLHSVGLRR